MARAAAAGQRANPVRVAPDSPEDTLDEDDSSASVTHPIKSYFEPDLSKPGNVRCIRCKRFSIVAHVSRQAGHLQVCAGLSIAEKDKVNKIILQRNGRSRTKRPYDVVDDTNNPDGPPSKGLLTAHFQPFGKEKQRQADKLLANWVYAAELPFHPVENEHFGRFVRFFNSAYVAPSADMLSGTLLDERYAEIRLQVSSVLERVPWLTIVTDGW